jgi:signal transduction histidine kinase
MAAGAIGAGNTLEQVAALLLIRRLVPSRRPFDRARDVFWFVLAAALSSALASTNGATSLWLTGIVPGAIYGPVWFTWWLGDTAGMLVLTPLLAALWERPFVRRRPRLAVEAGLFLALLLVTCQVVFGGWFRAGAVHQSLGFTLIPFLVWAAFRFGPLGVQTSTVLVSGAAVWGTIHRLGPFVRADLNDSMLLLQAFIGISTVTGLALSAVLTERRRAEEALQQAHGELQRHAGQLEAANKELEAFAYSVSHDLRAPLRGIAGFSQVLMEDYADRLDEEGKQALRRVQAAAQRMAQLIDDLLNLSRITRGELRREPVDLSALARTLAAELQQRGAGRPVEVVIADGLVAEGDARLLRVVLENLLANAWKFTAKKPRARVEFGADRRNGGPATYFVRDNGAGFDMRYAGKLFGAFQRLHTVHEFPGNGIGLATVQRIIHRHGGRVWAEGAVDNGATFYFAL